MNSIVFPCRVFMKPCIWNTNCPWKYKMQCMTYCDCSTNTIFHLSDFKFHIVLATPMGRCTIMAIIYNSKLRKDLVLLYPHLHPGLLSFYISIHLSILLIYIWINFAVYKPVLHFSWGGGVKILFPKSGYEHVKIITFKILDFQWLTILSW